MMLHRQGRRSACSSRAARVLLCLWSILSHWLWHCEIMCSHVHLKRCQRAHQDAHQMPQETANAKRRETHSLRHLAIRFVAQSYTCEPGDPVTVASFSPCLYKQPVLALSIACPQELPSSICSVQEYGPTYFSGGSFLTAPVSYLWECQVTETLEAWEALLEGLACLCEGLSRCEAVRELAGEQTLFTGAHLDTLLSLAASSSARSAILRIAAAVPDPAASASLHSRCPISSPPQTRAGTS